MVLLIVVMLAITSLLLPLSVYPGLLSELGFLAAISSPFWLPAACVTCWVFVDVRREVADVLGPPSAPRRWLVPAALVVILNCGLLWAGAPRRLAFVHARSAFETCVAAARRSHSVGESFDRRLGLYHVDRLASDPRGGVYFRTRSSPDMFRARTITYGFSFRPNPAGCPFGDEQYTLAHVVGDWYAFQASAP
jgi:hypothetical protein